MAIPKKTALISVYHKEGIVEFARELKKLGWDILASGGTAKHLREAGVEVVDIADKVGKPILGHRVVTLSREVHAGILAKDTPEQNKELEEQGIARIDLVCVDLYPLEAEIGKGSAREAVIEMTDIGGPTMLRSAAKGGRIVICDPRDREDVIKRLNENSLDEPFVQSLAAKAEFVVAKYCLASAEYLSGKKYGGLVGERTAECLYGENAWQTPAGLYTVRSDDPLALDKFTLIEGTSPSYNNWIDLDRSLQTLTHIEAAFEAGGTAKQFSFYAVGVKHGNPCGAAYGASEEEVLQKVIAGDPRAIMGGLVIVNFKIEAGHAEILTTHLVESGRRILDAIAAPGFSPEAIELLRRKKDKCRFLANEHLADANLPRRSLSEADRSRAEAGGEMLAREPRVRQVRGGFLVQPNYTFVLNMRDSAVVRYGAETPGIESDLALAWAVGSTSNSNTITLVRGGMLLGNGVGQQDRVGAAKLAVARAENSALSRSPRWGLDEAGRSHEAKAENPTRGAVAYSDSFFPFPDGPQVLIDAGITAILATSGSVNDKDTIALCEKTGVTLYMIPDKMARGFFGH
ncbi:MAG: hypothetical protein A2946_02810 [Candidatus Liptonbacteria bacterium RIFCSPLOWO2_01_FULL_53_13]|uniref:MGS-like domain-containing protein n=1 Tax=Candidatus Liptonbacteria bacterium RIFCSPLOWO2_01_FULL_53_13 TaxID=1798651 RepID=A0A1G2CMK7_9BACT|nr:MAG: hypothetical protein A2946_02810 [Candidatus Liptonbacteria bacterium RIFCSPLOWO2_01_FULL_53_13]